MASSFWSSSMRTIMRRSSRGERVEQGFLDLADLFAAELCHGQAGSKIDGRVGLLRGKTAGALVYNDTQVHCWSLSSRSAGSLFVAAPGFIFRV